MDVNVRTGRTNLGVYMDYQASTPVDPRVLDSMLPWLQSGYGNPHANDHAYGWEADRAIDDARGKIAALVNAEPEEIIFTSGATEANNLAILGAARAADASRRRVIVSAIEHKCVLGAARSLAEAGFDVQTIPVDDKGLIDLEVLKGIIDDQTALVSVMTINNEVGSIQPIDEVAALCEIHGALFHTDAAQALSVHALDVSSTKIDLMSFSGHKAYGPKGIGGLFVNRSARRRIQPITFGGGQEDGLRPGTLPTFLCVGLGEACAIIAKERDADVARMRRLQSMLIARLQSEFPSALINGTTELRHPGNLNIRIPGVEAELLLARAHPRLAGASGSACTSGIPEPSHVLVAMGQSAVQARAAIRLSFGRFTQEQDINETIAALKDALTGMNDAAGEFV
ncbi:UNVERIFIED_ORG: cysteine desulfurase [Rhizobium sp. SORGH_AS260]|uniref:cysteine desulfurase family protein n=1 Tax=Agrobacterium sp. SORGH_AS_0440 TaxID=3041757 RepID=UPI00278A6335|nr:cysteine desulfurase family protein [Agrobacterium sp. SORGH_AS_0440]MDP9734518.1 cysteine desulfurase [Rhizobium sp. SORGH_AS_0285]MDP9756737.1 cysteine desulfurase [Rhizobium sp. SORGH_AS_0260]MDR6084012.1 cysteine desulfurase [Agrobacterium sp. SORGH_AS_0440]